MGAIVIDDSSRLHYSHGRTATIEFLLKVSLNSVNSVTKKIFINQVRNCSFHCKRPGCYHSISKTQMRDRIFKLTPIHNLSNSLNSLNSNDFISKWVAWISMRNIFVAVVFAVTQCEWSLTFFFNI